MTNLTSKVRCTPICPTCGIKPCQCLKEQLTSKDLSTRLAEVVQEHLEDLQNERASYEGYAERQRRYDVAIAEDRTLLVELRAYFSHEPRAEHPLSSGDAIACIGMALQNPDTDEWPQLLRDCMHVIERMEGELLDAKRQRNAEVKLRQAAERAAPPPTATQRLLGAAQVRVKDYEKALREIAALVSGHDSIVCQEVAYAVEAALYSPETKSAVRECDHGVSLSLPCEQCRHPVETLAVDPERVEIPRCRCGGFPRPTLMGRMICSACGNDL